MMKFIQVSDVYSLFISRILKKRKYVLWKIVVYLCRIWSNDIVASNRSWLNITIDGIFFPTNLKKLMWFLCKASQLSPVFFISFWFKIQVIAFTFCKIWVSRSCGLSKRTDLNRFNQFRSKEKKKGNERV